MNINKLTNQVSLDKLEKIIIERDWAKVCTGIILLDDEVYEWLYKHTTAYWYRDLRGVLLGENYLYFKSKEDAALYKLTWL